jgi:hypothetical protein
MRKRLEMRIRKAMRIAAQFEPEFVLRCTRRERAGHALEHVLRSVVADRAAQESGRRLAAELLTLGGVARAFEPIIEQYLDCEGSTAWDLHLALPYERVCLGPDQQQRIADILRHHPEEERRAAITQFLGRVESRAAFELLLETVQNDSETGYSAAELPSHSSRTITLLPYPC